MVFSTGYDVQADIANSQLAQGSLSKTIYKTGPGSFKSLVNSSDASNVSSGWRSEVQYGSLQTPNEGCIEYDVMYESVCKDNCHSLQYHPETAGGSCAPGFMHISGKFVWSNWKNGGNTQYQTGYTIPTNKWLHIVYRYKFASNGYAKWLVDGQVLPDKTNIHAGYGSGQYLKLGQNLWNVNIESVLY